MWYFCLNKEKNSVFAFDIIYKVLKIMTTHLISKFRNTIKPSSDNENHTNHYFFDNQRRE